MLFSSPLFLFLFLPAVLLAYGIGVLLEKRFPVLGKGHTLCNLILLVFSLVFYAWGEPIYSFLMIGTILIGYFSGLLIHRFKETKPKAAKTVLIVNIILNLGILGFFKYCNFFIDTVSAVTGMEIEFLTVALPIGISFYTFQTMSYPIDLWRGDTTIQKNIFSFGAYVTIFPQLIAGPIVRYKTVAEQLDTRTVTWNKVASGIRTFTVGLAKKVLIANNIGAMWDTVNASHATSVLGQWLGILAFAFQIYFDFSGYSDMAIGLGRIFGFEFDQNFNYPYISKSATEFWRRWHISLGTWFREYLYIPLGGNRVSTLKWLRNILIVWFCTGFWHGASWNFIVWGLYFGILLILERKFLNKVFEKIPAAFQHIYFILVTVIGWTFFAIEDMGKGLVYLQNMFGAGGVPFANTESVFLLVSYLPMLLIALFFSLPLFEQIWKTGLESKHQTVFRTAETVIFSVIWIVCTSYLVAGTYNPFLYFRF